MNATIGGRMVSEDEKLKRPDRDLISEDEKRRRRLRSLRRRGMTGSTKNAHNLRNRSKQAVNCQFAPIFIEVLNKKEEKAVNAFRQVLIDRDMLPARHDDYHTLLRFLKARKFDLDKTIHMWAEMLNWRKMNRVDSIIQNWMSFGKVAHDLVMRIQRIDGNNYPETLHHMFIVNAGGGFKCLWNSAKGFLDPRTASKIHVLGTKFQNKLLEVIDASQLPDFLGGSCLCENQGGCLRSDKGPWNDQQLIKLVHGLRDGESIFRRNIASFSGSDDFKFKDLGEIFQCSVSGAGGFEIKQIDLKGLRGKSIPSSCLRHSSHLTLEPAVHCSDDPVSTLEPLDGAEVQNHFPSNMTLVPELRPPRGSISTAVTDVIFRLVACLCFLLHWLLNFFLKMVKIDTMEDIRPGTPFSSSDPQFEDSTHQSSSELLHPCCQKLQHLENMVTEVQKKPAKLPPEKDGILLEYMNRIKSIEYDLQKTKKALLETASKQAEVSKSLENLKERKSRVSAHSLVKIT